ncbi:MAG: imelysin family protein [Hyphomicrobiaceae bacterium]
MGLLSQGIARCSVQGLILAMLCALPVPASAFDHEAFARRALEQHIVPAYRRFLVAADAQDAAVTALCAAPGDATFASARQTFSAALDAWGRVEHIRFGPIMDQNRYSGLLLWPDPRGIARRQIERALTQQDKDVLSPEALADKSVALRGFTALDILLFAAGSEDLTKSEPAGAFRCGYASAVAKVIARVAKDTLQAWSAPDGFAARWLYPGPDNPVFLSAKETTQAIGQAYLNGLKQLRNVRFAGPLGFKDRSVRALEPPVSNSGRALALAVANIEGLRALLLDTGLSEPLTPGTPPHSVMQATVTEFETAISTIRKAALSKKPFEEANARNQLILIGFPLKNAFDTGAAYLAEEAGLTIGFNALDGD